MDKSPVFNCIVAMTPLREIGANGEIPWRLEEDMKYFYKTTMGNGNNAVVMGRKTWDSIPLARRPLKGRLNIVISTKLSVSNTDCIVFPDFDIAIEELAKLKELDTVWIIGGESIYRQALSKHGLISNVYITMIPRHLIKEDLPHFGSIPNSPPICDTWFPELRDDEFELDEEYESSKVEGVKIQVWGRCTRI
jgi:dihydrofolate reductase